MIELDGEKPLDRIMKAAARKIKESEEDMIIREIADAIGDRRIRDLNDLISELETKTSWSIASEYLIQAQDTKYSIPPGFGLSSITIEPLKYREVVFEVFGCTGLEPVNREIKTILEEVSTAKSNVDAKREFSEIVESIASEQIQSGDTLFFVPDTPSNQLSMNLDKTIQDAQQQKINSTRIAGGHNIAHIKPLWFTEQGRRALADLGLKGNDITIEDFNMLISVIQVSPDTKKNLMTLKSNPKDVNPLIPPSNPLYKNLLEGIINHDYNSLASLGSYHAAITLNNTLRVLMDNYKTSEDSSTYRNLISMIRNHVQIRALDSIIVLCDLVLEKNERLATPGIRALGNFYHESSISTLIDVICSKTAKDIQDQAITSLDNIRYRCPETKTTIETALSSNCRNISRLRKYYKRHWNHKL